MPGTAVRSVPLMVDRGDFEAWKTPGGHRRISRLSVDHWRHDRGIPPVADRGAPRAAVSPGRPSANGPAPRVLLIEDASPDRNPVSRLLQQQFAQVDLHVADDGTAGLGLARQLRPGMLVVDLRPLLGQCLQRACAAAA